MEDDHDNSNYRSQQIEDNEFLSKWDIEKSYVGSQKPDIERPQMSAIDKLRAIQGDWDKDYLPEDSGMTKGDRNGRD